MPTLTWHKREEAVRAATRAPYRLLEPVPELSHGDADNENLLIQGDKRPGGGNVLTGKVLRDLPKHDGPKVIYGECTSFGEERLRREGVVFKQIPYDVKRR